MLKSDKYIQYPYVQNSINQLYTVKSHNYLL